MYMYVCTCTIITYMYLIFLMNITIERIEPSPKAKICNVNHQQDPHDYKEVPHLEWLHRMTRQQLLCIN